MNPIKILRNVLSMGLVLLVACFVLSAEGQAGKAAGTAVKSPELPLIPRKIDSRDAIKWNATLNSAKKGTMTVVLDLGGLSHLAEVKDLKVTVALYRKGKLIATKQFSLGSMSQVVTGGAKYSKDFKLSGNIDEIKPVGLDGTVRSNVYVYQEPEIDRRPTV